ncbi:MAG: glycosyltransferase [Rhodobacterales bacterium]|nr:glycosyltransferase [Rhodobacterales bacterium]
MKIAVAIATVGRPQILGHAIRDLARQTRQPDRTIISATSFDDVDPSILSDRPARIDIIYGGRGLPRQRNAVLDALGDEDVVLFLDDDFMMAPDFLCRLEELMSAQPSIGIVTGDVLADGIGNAGLTPPQAQTILDRAMDEPCPDLSDLIDVNNGYGCNMAFRCAPIRTHGLRFDEQLPLYAWLEDVDFSRRAAAYGRCVKAMALRGVHLGIKGGRTSGVRLGYSQVANPIYLIGRATMQRRHAARLISRNIAANLAKSLWSEPWVDRRGRLHGNLLALADLIRGRIDPLRVLDLESRNNGRS